MAFIRWEITIPLYTVELVVMSSPRALWGYALSDEPELFESGGEASPAVNSHNHCTRVDDPDELASDVEVEDGCGGGVGAVETRRAWTSAALQLDPRVAQLENSVSRLLNEAALLHEQAGGDLPALAALRSQLEALRGAPSAWPGPLSSVEREDMVRRAERLFEADRGVKREDVEDREDRREEDIEFRNTWSGLEKRVDWLEKCVGRVEPGQMLAETVQRLECSVRAFDQEAIDMARMNLERLRDERKSIVAIESKQSQAEIEARDEIVNVIARWDDMAESLPMLIGRLETLDRVHKLGEHAVSRLESMEDAIRRMEEKLQRDDDVLSRLESQQLANWQAVKGNIEALNSRIDRLKLPDAIKEN
jgi:hypothetical protein